MFEKIQKWLKRKEQKTYHEGCMTGIIQYDWRLSSADIREIFKKGPVKAHEEFRRQGKKFIHITPPIKQEELQ